MNAETLATLLEYFDLKQFFQLNSPVRLLIILGVVCLLCIGARLLCAVLEKKIEKLVAGRAHGSASVETGAVPFTSMDFELFERVMKHTRRILYLIILDCGLRQITIGPLYLEVERILFVGLCILAGIEFFTAFVPFSIDLYLRARGTTLQTSQTRSLLPIVKAVIWAIGLTFLLDNLGFHVSTIIAGLGIVGVAVGLAGQAILADFFSYIVILLDKPFRIGDYVELSDGKAGDVEYMGPKTTHLRNLDDDLIICANSVMTKGILVNQGSIHEREVILDIGVAYDTPYEKLKNLPEMLQDIIASFPQCRFDRACLVSFGSSNLNFEIMYFVSEQRGGIRAYMLTRSAVNMAILAKFNEENINMAYPTEHVLLTSLDGQPRPAASETGANASKGTAGAGRGSRQQA